MEPHRWLALLVCLSLGTFTLAQNPRFNNPNERDGRTAERNRVGMGLPVFPSPRPSHQPLDIDLGEGLSPEELLANRLRLPRDQQKLKEQLGRQQLPEELQQLARRLLGNEQFLQSLRERFRPEDLNRLRDQVLRGENLDLNDNLRQFLKEGLGNRQLSDNEQQALQRWAEQLRNQPDNPVEPVPEPIDPVPPPPDQPPDMPVPPPSSLQPPSPPRNNEWWQNQMSDLSRRLETWLDSPDGRAWRDRLIELAQRNAPAGSALVERVQGLSRYLPQLSNYLPRLPRANLPRVAIPRQMPRVPTLPRPSALSVGQWLIGLLGGVLFALALWYLLRLGQSMVQPVGKPWHPGPWPVSPARLASRQDVVRAFEYLCLLTLGKSARLRHHLELGRQLGQQAAVDPQRRQQAALALTRLYERARYAPADEPLSQAELEEARRELCYLAGVAA
jgi:hypothetical protein